MPMPMPNPIPPASNAPIDPDPDLMSVSPPEHDMFARATKSGWTAEDDQRLEAAVEEHMRQKQYDEEQGIRPRSTTNSPSIKSWAEIARTAFPNGRFNKAACSSRWRTLRRPKTNRGQWSQSEDKLLLQIVQEVGQDRWPLIAERIGSRTAKQCRERWNNHVDPTINKAPFTPEESAKIMSMYTQMGSKWSEMAKQLPGRPDNRIKNHFNTVLNRRARRVQTHSMHPAPHPHHHRHPQSHQYMSDFPINGAADSGYCALSSSAALPNGRPSYPPYHVKQELASGIPHTCPRSSSSLSSSSSPYSFANPTPASHHAPAYSLSPSVRLGAYDHPHHYASPHSSLSGQSKFLSPSLPSQRTSMSSSSSNNFGFNFDSTYPTTQGNFLPPRSNISIMSAPMAPSLADHPVLPAAAGSSTPLGCNGNAGLSQAPPGSGPGPGPGTGPGPMFRFALAGEQPLSSSSTDVHPHSPTSTYQSTHSTSPYQPNVAPYPPSDFAASPYQPPPSEMYYHNATSGPPGGTHYPSYQPKAASYQPNGSS